MIGQCLSNKNESAKLLKFKNFLDLNKEVALEVFAFLAPLPGKK